MEVTMDWKITVGSYQLALLDSVEIHCSVDLLSDTCTIRLPGFVHNTAFREEQKIKRGDRVHVWLGYNKTTFQTSESVEFEGYLLNIATDDGSMTLNCEDALFLFRKPVKDKSFAATGIKAIAQYVISEIGMAVTINSTLDITYEKFVISNATGYDVLKKLQEETKANIYLTYDSATNATVLNIHPPYTEKHGRVRYSFQQNIEESDLKYRRMEDKRIQVVVQNTDKAGKKREVRSGTTGGDTITITAHGLSESAMKTLADAEFRRQSFDGYEGSITTWLVPYVAPGYSAEIKDEDYEYKDGWYYVTAVTTTFDNSGAVRKVQLGIKVAA